MFRRTPRPSVSKAYVDRLALEIRRKRQVIADSLGDRLPSLDSPQPGRLYEAFASFQSEFDHDLARAMGGDI